MKTFTDSRIGPRTNNEDNFFIQINEENECLAVICDGLGGHANGELAAQTVIENIKKLTLWTSPFIHHALNESHRQCLNKYDGRATTATVLWLSPPKEKIITHNKNNQELVTPKKTIVRTGYIYHTGDTRIYLIKKNKSVHQVTEDQGIGHNLYSCIGGRTRPDILFYEIEKEEKDIIVMSTDGYHDYDNLLRKNLISLLLDFEKLKDPATWLLDKVTEKTQDNNTVVIIR